MADILKDELVIDPLGLSKFDGIAEKPRAILTEMD